MPLSSSDNSLLKLPGYVSMLISMWKSATVFYNTKLTVKSTENESCHHYWQLL